MPVLDWLVAPWRFRGPRTHVVDAALSACAAAAYHGDYARVRGGDYIQFGCSPLIAAAALGDSESVRGLLRLGADPRALSPCGLTAITVAGERGVRIGCGGGGGWGGAEGTR